MNGVHESSGVSSGPSTHRRRKRPAKRASTAAADKRAAAQAFEMAEQERRRIGRELQDGICQQLAGLALVGQSLEEQLRREKHPVADKLKRCRQEILAIIAETRRMARGLSPTILETDGLAAALEALANEADSPGRQRCRFVCKREIVIDDPGIATHLFRIAQEAVNNALRHSGARSIRVILEEEQGKRVLTVRDDGAGMDHSNPPPGTGLGIMEARARLIGGRLAVGPAVGGGTTVTCIVPISQSDHDA